MRGIVGQASNNSAARSVLQRLLPWLCLVAVLAAPGVAAAMGFRIYYQPQLNMKMVVGEGRIEDGDAKRFQSAVKRADRDDEGLVVFILDSPGGNVEAAFRMVDVMDKAHIYTVVPNGAKCASACASILFASGARRSVVGSGMLGFHSCYRHEGNTYAEDSLCNEIIAANAMLRGVSHAAINRFVDKYGATEMAWVGPNIACRSLQGLCKPGRLEGRSGAKDALARSFGCSKLTSVAGQLICGDAELTRADDQLARIYDQKMKTSPNKARLRADQRTWLRDSRNVCVDKACLMRSYQRRIDELQRVRS